MNKQQSNNFMPVLSWIGSTRLALTIVAFALVGTVALPQKTQAAVSAVELQSANLNLSDRQSLQNGAKIFVNYCLSCHSAELMRYERMAEDLGISQAVVKENMMFTTDKIGNRMISNMSEEDSKAWFGKTPPDLSVISRARRPDYIYTYLVSFYKDPTTVTGWNNAVLQNAAMPHVMYEQQGVQVLAHHDAEADSSGEQGEQGDHGDAGIFELVSPGTMSTAEFNKSMQDLTNFLAYMAEPAALKRISLGFWVMAFLGVLLALTWMLKKEYWRDIYGDDDTHH